MAEKSSHPRLIVGISGASGVIYGARLLEVLRPLPVETHLVMSRTAEVTLALETDLKPAVVRSRADVVHPIGDLAAPISSGSYKTIGMVIAPCSIRSMAEIASGVTTTLLSRAADVVLEPSAGTGLLAMLAELAGASLVLNEFAEHAACRFRCEASAQQDFTRWKPTSKFGSPGP